YLLREQGPLLLGAVYVMPRAGEQGPAVGGAITQWHAHLVCVGPTPPFLVGLPSPFGGCPAASVALTSPEMMHVWIVDNPDGPYTEKLDAATLARLRGP